jgi:type I protein arginine methyltransferase
MSAGVAAGVAAGEEDGNLSDWSSDGEENVEVKDLFSSKVFSSVSELISHTKAAHNFDIAEIVGSFGAEDEITIILLINFIRSTVASCEGQVNPLFIEQLKETIMKKEFLNKEEYMIPYLQDDNLLFLLGETLLRFDENEEDTKGDNEEDWDTTKSKFAFFSQVSGKDSDLKQADSAKVEEMRAALDQDGGGDEEPSDYYFGGYSHIGIHETMLRDAARTNAYADALLKNADFVKGKVVLDVGCGTGILCLLAAKAGAKKVIGVDMSSIIERSRKVVKKNGYEDVITLVRGKLEEVTLPVECGEVDIIVSEWMGYGLYFENMLPAVMYAKEKYLKKGDSSSPSSSDEHRGGIVMPSDAILFIEAVTAETHNDDRVSWWGDVYGFDMTEMTELFTAEAQVEVTREQDIVSDRARMHSLDIGSAVDEDLDFSAPFAMVDIVEYVVDDGCMHACRCM